MAWTKKGMSLRTPPPYRHDTGSFICDLVISYKPHHDPDLLPDQEAEREAEWPIVSQARLHTSAVRSA